jgi:hypothetical protein
MGLLQEDMASVLVAVAVLDSTAATSRHPERRLWQTPIHRLVSFHQKQQQQPKARSQVKVLPAYVVLGAVAEAAFVEHAAAPYLGKVAGSAFRHTGDSSWASFL